MLTKRTYNHCYVHLSAVNVPYLIPYYYSTITAQILLQNSPKPSNYLVYCNSQITKNGRSGRITEAESIFKSMPSKNIISWTAMLTAYADNGKIKKAREVFDEIPQRNIASWNAMITAYFRNNRGIDEAGELFGQMPERNGVSYAAMITGFVRAGMMEKAEELYSQTPENWRDPVCANVLISGHLRNSDLKEAVRIFEGMGKKDVVSWSSMVDGYCKQGRIVEARGLFDRMPERNVVTWSALINGYLKMGSFKEGFGVFSEMRREDSVKVNSTTLATVFEACGNLGRHGEGFQVHGLVLRVGFELDVFLGNSVITMYCRFGCLEAASNVFDMMNTKDVVSWNSLIAGYVQAQDVTEAYRLFEKMPEKDMVSWTTMVKGFSGKGLMGKSVEFFSMMHEKDDVAWTAVIAGFVSGGEFEESISWFIQMLQKTVRPNPLTFSSVLSASAGLATLNQGLQIHSQILKMNMEFDLSVQNSLVSMYSKCGNVYDAHRIFQSIRVPNIVSFNSMITGFAQNGLGMEVFKLLKKMQDEGQEPNEITFLGVLSACAHVGLVEEGWNYFKSMRSSHSIEPKPDHYTCMVDLLGRSGLLDEAMNLINSMPFEPHSGVWGALLGASKIHLRLDLAKLAAQHLFELEPDSATPYVVLSDIYSTAGNGHGGEQVRLTKNCKGIKKSPGCSWIILKEKVHLFSSGDKSHRNFQEIRRALRTIMDEMKQPNCL